jgi:calcium binding protein
MTKQTPKPVVVHMDVRKLKSGRKANLPSVSPAKLNAMIEEATVDAYNEEEQTVGFLVMLQEHLAVPFSTKILGIEVSVEKIDMTDDGQVVAFCRRDKMRQKIGILDLPLPTPAPAGAEWITAYRHWRKGIR